MACPYISPKGMSMRNQPENDIFVSLTLNAEAVDWKLKPRNHFCCFDNAFSLLERQKRSDSKGLFRRFLLKWFFVRLQVVFDSQKKL